jgi:ABC-type uncharacterized transport system auxiliary subunit
VWPLIVVTGTLLAASGTTCLGGADVEQSYFVLHGKTARDYRERPVRGLLRVRTLHADAVYEKFQIAVRRNPYELRYDEQHVWVAKPKRMISDFVAQALKESGRFENVTRELGERRPDYNLSGDLHAIEVYDSGELWFAHLALSLRLTRFATGEALYALEFDERERLSDKSFALAARALSELLARAVEKMMADLDRIDALHEVTLPAATSLPRADDGAALRPRSGRRERRAEREDPSTEPAPAAAVPPTDDERAREPDPAPAADGVILVPQQP